MERLLRRNGDQIERVCHYGHENRCYDCADRTKCNADIFDRLAHYEDLEEQGRLMELPCKVGDTVWYIGGIHNTLIKPARVTEIIVANDGVLDLCVETDNNICYEDNIKNFFLTCPEAEAALAASGKEG